MKLLRLDASEFSSSTELYEALLAILGAPAWHGRNFNALRDSLSGGINQVEAPFTVEIANSKQVHPELATFLYDLLTVFDGARDDFGMDVHMQLR
jgi:RNAse (barnase) inhibitor barstar